jgi:hypothetical protein
MKKRYMLGGIGLLIDVAEKIIKSNKPNYESNRPMYNVNERLTSKHELIERGEGHTLVRIR